MVFDLSKPHATVTRSSMAPGGGWIVPTTDEGREALAEFFGEAPADLAPLGGESGYIVEPYQSGDLAEFMRERGLAWEVA